MALCCAEWAFLSYPSADLGVVPLVALVLVGDEKQSASLHMLAISTPETLA